jgi:hypothetical protein
MLHRDTLQRLTIVPAADMPDFDRDRAASHNRLVLRANENIGLDVYAAGVALIVALDGFNRIAIAHKGLAWNEDKTPIGADHYAGPLFLDMGKSLQGMLAMDSRSALLSYKADQFILETLHTNGFSEDETA